MLDATIARAETLLVLLEPAAKALQALTDAAGEPLGAWRSSWEFNLFFPYLARDWTNTAELEAMNATIGAALSEVFPDPSGKSVAFAGCGAGGLLDVSSGFERVMGFDLALPMLAAARHLLDGNTLDLALPRAIKEAGRLSLRKRDPASATSHVELLAMDALDTAFADGSLDCVVTSFLTDLMPDPRRLADEIHRILSADGVWINYGPPGSLESPWRFDQPETTAFFEAMGFTTIRADAHHTTYLDLSRDCPKWPFRNNVCYLTSARKAGPRRERPRVPPPSPAELAEIVPQHFPFANLIERRSLEGDRKRTVSLRYERMAGRPESLELGGDTARIVALVDGKRTVREIADLLAQAVPAKPAADTIRAVARYFDQGLLDWRGRGQ